MLTPTQSSQFKDLLQNLVIKNNNMSAKEIAKAIRKPYSTLLRESNPTDICAKLGAETLFGVMQATGEVEPLRWMAQELGYALVPRTEATA